MSYNTNKNFVYYHQGKVFHIYRITRNVGRGIDTNGVTKEYGLQEAIYPDETITDGIRIEYTALEKPFVVQDPESTAYASLTEVTSPIELSHVNLNRMLSLAIVDYLKAMTAERDGDLQRKEYYMKSFHKKVSDNESNKNNIYIVQSTSYAVK
tara:strand:- start:72 stop:530 length:459 start_codon:yes stop_codon:yes gene_type:complete